MSVKEIQKIEKIAKDSLLYARQAIKKSEELHAYLSLLEYKSGRKKIYASVDSIFKKLSIR